MTGSKTSESVSVRAAIYARVSSDQQAQQGTIDSQIADLRQRVQADGSALDEELCFVDDGYTGSTLIRPALERLRDTAWAGGFQRLYVHSPDRLARKYAWQVLLVEELQRSGVELVFLNRTIGASPEEDLLLQMQGMIAEYERTKIMERSRRGKRHAARRGAVSVLTAAPYGYRYISKHEGGGQAYYQVDFEQAKVVQQVFEWIGRDRLSIREVCRRLARQGIPSAKGKRWSSETVGKMLKNPAYIGQAVFGKTRMGPRRPQLRTGRGRPAQPRHAASRYAGKAEDQIPIPVPAIVSEELFEAAAEQLAENRRRARRRKRGPGYLLQGLLECGCCGYALYGHGLSRFARNKAFYPYYRCSGRDAYRHGGERICSNKPVRMDRLDAAVWADVCELLQNPAALQHEFERRLGGDEDEGVNATHVGKQIAATRRSISRLIDAYEDGLLDKGEFEPRIRHARQRLERLEQEAAAASDRATRQAELRLVLSHMEQFAEQVRQGLDTADMNTRREIIRSLVKVVKIEEGHVRIIYRVSPRPFADGRSSGPILQHCLRRVRRHPTRDQHQRRGQPLREGRARSLHAEPQALIHSFAPFPDTPAPAGVFSGLTVATTCPGHHCPARNHRIHHVAKPRAPGSRLQDVCLGVVHRRASGSSGALHTYAMSGSSGGRRALDSHWRTVYPFPAGYGSSGDVELPDREMEMDRREFLKLGSVGALGAIASSLPKHAAGASDELAFEPKAIDGPIVNPGIGFETFHCFNGDDRIARASNYPECSIAYFRFYWDLLEPTEGKYNFDLIDSLLKKAAERGQDLALRFMPTCPSNLKRGTPKWFMQKGKGFAYERRGRKGWAPDHNDPYYLARQLALVQAFGERYNGHRRLIRMEIGSVGFWGEWHMSHTKPVVPMITEANAVKIIDMYLRHWDKTPLCMLIGFVPGLRHAVSRGTGWRADSLGDYGHWSDTWCHMTHSYPRKLKEARAHDAWKRGPVAFEPPGSMRDLERYVPSKGGGYDNTWKQALGWGGSAFNPKSGPIPAAQVPAMKRFLAKCGYRIVLRRLVTSKSLARADRHLPVTMEFENHGVAPPYRDYALVVRMTGGAAPIVLKSSAKVREWLPGPHKLRERLQLPDGLGAGQYALAIALLDPADQQPAVRLANGGRNRDGWYPVGTIAVT